MRTSRIITAALPVLLAAGGAATALAQTGPKRPLALTCNAKLEDYAGESDAGKRAQNMLDMAWKCWLDYDAYENRNNSGTLSGAPSKHPKFEEPGMSISSMAPSRATFPVEQVMLIAASKLREDYAPLPFDVAGEADYLKARTLAQEAYRLAPSNVAAFRLLSQLAVARSNWAELERLAADFVRRNPRDAWARMAHALGAYRQKPGKDAGTRFDSALTVMDAKERSRLDRFERLLRPKDIPGFAKLDSQSRTATIRSTWLLADPLWSSRQADPRAEFLARLTFAEIRWTIDEQRRGADTDRGDIYIRYGPPNQVMFSVGKNTQIGHVFWIYNAGIAFAFQKQMHYGTAHFAAADVRTNLINRMKDWVPARWDNIATARIDSMPTQLARFRSGADTVEVFLATRAPVESIQLVGMAGQRPLANLWLYGLDTPAAFVDSVPVGASGVLQWTRRLGAGSYYYRIESMIPGTLVAGRAAAGMAMGKDSTSGFAMLGFGLSDVLLATKTNPAPVARRWIDFDPEPLLGDVKKGSTLSLVWETYELAQRGQDARYEVHVTLERGTSGAGRIAAQIVSRVASMIGVDASDDDRLAMKFDRVMPHSATIADNITIALGDTPAGIYMLTLRITDRGSGRATSRSMSVTIRE